MGQTGKLLMFIGIMLLGVGAILYFAGDKMSWIGNLPGDIRKEGDNVSFYFPITTMIILTIMINVLLRVFRHLTQ